MNQVQAQEQALPNYYVQTNRSWLCTYPNNFANLDEIIEEIDNQLESNLTIMIYGKECIQRRSIGFFSND